MGLINCVINYVFEFSKNGTPPNSIYQYFIPNRFCCVTICIKKFMVFFVRQKLSAKLFAL